MTSTPGRANRANGMGADQALDEERLGQGLGDIHGIPGPSR